MKEIYNEITTLTNISENQKLWLFAGIIIAMQNTQFNQQNATNETILKAINEHINENSIQQTFEFIFKQNEFKINALQKITRKIYEVYNRKINDNPNVDYIAQFYNEFIKKTGGDKKNLGIVLTPQHITQLFVELADVNQKSIVLDPCCGTAGFLIAANTKQAQTVGTEEANDMYALAVANMISKTNNIYLKKGSCFELKEDIKKYKPTVGFVNPPYSLKNGPHELEFVLLMMECVQNLGIAIVPISELNNNKIKEQLLQKHTLEAVMNMNKELFPNVATHTAVLVFKANQKHPQNYKTWFANWKNDGFVAVKAQGRIDKYNRWNDIMTQWIHDYKNRTEISNMAVNQCVTHEDEWNVDAYINTDYSNITTYDFLKVWANYINDTQYKYNSVADVLINPPK